MAGPVVNFPGIAGWLEAQAGGDAALDTITSDNCLARQPLPAGKLHHSTYYASQPASLVPLVWQRHPPMSCHVNTFVMQGDTVHTQSCKATLLIGTVE